MGLAANLRRLSDHRLFRTLLGIRILGQAGDAAMQVGLASHVLFNPASAPTAWAITTLLAITLLPFSLAGPFVSGLLDRWPRRQVSVVVDSTRAVLSLFVVVVLWQQGQLPGSSAWLFGALLVALGLNRFVLAGLSAALEHTIDADEFLTASAIMPMIGPTTLLVGGGLGMAVRVATAGALGPDRADALIFVLAACFWAGSALLALRVPRHAFGPTTPAPHTAARETVRALTEAMRHLAHRRPAALALASITIARMGYGATLTTVILLYRNHFGGGSVGGAMAGTSAWLGASALGFSLSVLVVPSVSQRLGMRATTALMIAASAVVQALPGSVLHPAWLVGAALVLGVFSQSLKICVDTIAQAHVDEGYKGRVFVVYDALYNAAIVAGAACAALVLPPDGASRGVLVGIGVVYGLLAAAFWAFSARIGSEPFNRGTELVRTLASSETAGTD